MCISSLRPCAWPLMGRVSNPSVCGLTIGMLSLAARVNVFSDGDNYGFVANSSLAARVISGSVFIEVHFFSAPYYRHLTPLEQMVLGP